MRERDLTERLAAYEGLIFKTAEKIGPVRGMDRDDVHQVLRIKAWRALEAYDPRRATGTERSFVFSCVYNQSKDLMKRNTIKAPPLRFIEDLCTARYGANGESRDVGARERFERRYLTTNPEAEYGAVEDDAPVLPSTLSHNEALIVWLLYLDYSREEVADELRVARRQVDAAIKGIRVKMADWDPGGAGAAELAQAA